MNQETRIQRIQSIIDQGNPHWKEDLRWWISLQSFDVYLIPLEYLIYNKYNWRILSRTLSLEKQWQLIDPETDDWKKLVEELLWLSKEAANKTTLKSLEQIWQEKVWIITKDGIIIDGNRRAMLLNRSKKRFFKTIVLPVTLEGDRKSIEELETKRQLWEDKKLDYNATEKYLKASIFEKEGMSTSEIAEWMWEEVSEIQKYLDVKKMMDKYLEYLEYDGIYTQLDWREDQLINLTRWVNYLSDGRNPTGSLKWFRGYTQNDVEDLMFLCFDYIRIKFEGKKFRNIGEWHKDNHLFWEKEIWDDFCKKHNDGIRSIRDNEPQINKNSPNLTAHLNSRDNEFSEKSKDFMDSNMDAHIEMISNRNSRNQPQKLVSKAWDALDLVDPKNTLPPDAINKVNSILEKWRDILSRNFSQVLLDNIILDLKAIDFKQFSEDELDIILEKLKEINKITYQMEKDNK